MGKKISVVCTKCGKLFLKEVKHYNYGLKKGWKPFCSYKCQSDFNKRRVKLKCFECKKDIEIIRCHYDKSETKRFFCSQSCSASFNNKLHGPKSQKQRNNIRNGLKKYYDRKGRSIFRVEKNCLTCGKVFRGHPNKQYFCSRDCYQIYEFGSIPYTKEDFLNVVSDIAIKTGRTPQRRDHDHKLYHAAVKFFGTWNKAMKACNLKPNHSKYQKIRLRCEDGHMADSISERIIDNWFFKNGIKHERNKKYPSSNMNCDFYFIDHNIWVEYFGLFGGDIDDYDNTIKLKEELAVKNGLTFISIKPNDLYNNKSISYDVKLRNIFSKYLTS